MVELEEGLHVYDDVVKETGIDPCDRTEEIKANQAWLLAKDNLSKTVHGDEVSSEVPVSGVPEGGDLPRPDEADLLSRVGTMELQLPRLRPSPTKRTSGSEPQLVQSLRNEEQRVPRTDEQPLMPNQNIRVPKEGVTANSKRIARAVDDQKWQEFRLSLKGKSTQTKLDMLAEYYRKNHTGDDKDWLETVEIRIDNYLKALARGGQLNMGVSLKKALEGGGIAKLPVKKG